MQRVDESQVPSTYNYYEQASICNSISECIRAAVAFIWSWIVWIATCQCCRREQEREINSATHPAIPSASAIPSEPLLNPPVLTPPAIASQAVMRAALPQPTSCIPRITTITYQEGSTGIRRIWPTDLTLLGLTENQKTEVDGHIRDAFRASVDPVSWSKKKLKYTNGNHQTVEATLPITLGAMKDNNGELRVLLFSKIIFASGGERKIRWVYDLTKGTFLLKKRITGLFEERILKYMLTLRMQRGITTSVDWRTSVDKQNNKKLQIIEPVRNGTLKILFGKDPLSNFHVKYDLILDLLTDLRDLHTGAVSGVKLSSESQELSYGLFHSDITPLNILVFLQNGKWRAELCDFGLAASHPLAYAISEGYTPPEYIHFYKEKRPFGIQHSFLDNDVSTAQFVIKHGQGRDVWSMGLVILTLLVEREEKVVWKAVFHNNEVRARNIPPLPCLKAILSGTKWGYYIEEDILKLKQETLDADLATLENEVVSRSPEKRTELATVFKILKTMMLRIDPDKRKSSAECLEAFKEIYDVPPLVEM